MYIRRREEKTPTSYTTSSMCFMSYLILRVTTEPETNRKRKREVKLSVLRRFVHEYKTAGYARIKAPSKLVILQIELLMKTMWICVRKGRGEKDTEID